MTRPTVLLMTIAVFAACGDKQEHPAVEFHVPALLGSRNDAVVEHVRKSCPSSATVGPSAIYCYALKGTSYIVDFDFDARDRIASLFVFSSNDAEIRATFDRVFAPILPDETREILRAALARDLVKDRRRIVYSLGGPGDINGSVLEKIMTDEGGDKSAMWILVGI